MGTATTGVSATAELPSRTSRFREFFSKLSRQRVLLLMSLPFILHIVLFRLGPVFGWIMAFQEYQPGLPLLGQEWVGLEQFRRLFADKRFWLVSRNTLAMAFIKLALGTVAAIVLAVLINETKNRPFKRSVQTISYLPHFISWVVAANIVLEVLSPRGTLNGILMNLGILEERVMWMGKPRLFWWVIGFSHVWKTAGFGAIIYLAAMTAIDPQLYEVADIDGAGRLQRIRHITLPGIRATVVILLIINIGQLMEAGFEQQYLLQNGLVMEYSEVFRTYVLRWGLKLQRFSFAAAAGIFRSVVSIVLVMSANLLAKRLGEETLV